MAPFSFPFLESNIPQYICYNTFFSQLVRFSTICSNTSGFAERVHIIYQKLLKRNYDKKKLEKTFNKFTCHYSENLIKYDIPIQKLWQVCLNYNSVTPPSIINKVSFADSNSIFQTNNYIPLRSPISLTNLGNTCYLNSVLQILFQVNTVVPFDIWINHLLLVDKIQCTNSLPLLAFYKFLYLCKLSTISEGELADFVYLLKSINPFFDYKMNVKAESEATAKLLNLTGVNSGATFAVECLSLLICTTVYVRGMPPSTGCALLVLRMSLSYIQQITAWHLMSQTLPAVESTRPSFTLGIRSE